MSSAGLSREQHTALLYEASKLLGAPANLNNALDNLLMGVFHQYGLSTCLLLMDGGDGVLRVAFSLGVSQTFSQSVSVPRGQGTIGVTYASALPRQLQAAKDVDGDELMCALF